MERMTYEQTEDLAGNRNAGHRQAFAGHDTGGGHGGLGNPRRRGSEDQRAPLPQLLDLAQGTPTRRTLFVPLL